MNNLIDFIKKFLHGITFVILMVLSIVLIYNSMNYPRFVIASYTQTLTAPVNAMSQRVIRHFSLDAENHYLVEQNMQLLRATPENFVQVEDSLCVKMDTLVDTLKRKVQTRRVYDYFSAKVVYNTLHKKHNYLIIDKGSKDGVTYDMAVLSATGVVGVVTNVSPHFATVTSLLHPESRISAKVMPSNHLGTIVWYFDQPNYLFLEDVTENTNINVGDSVFTSGYSNIFPANILVGTISAKSKQETNPFLTLRVEPSTDFGPLNIVYVVQNLYKAELDTLKSKMIHE